MFTIQIMKLMMRYVRFYNGSAATPVGISCGLATLNKPKSRQVYTNDGIITQNIFNAAVSTYVELKTNTNKLYLICVDIN